MLKGHWFCPVNRHGFEPANKGQVYFGRFYLGKRRLRQLRPHILSRHSFDGSVRARPATCLATKPAYLLRLSGRGQPHGGFSKTAKPSTCGFIFDNCGVVGGSRLNVVDGPVSWRPTQRELRSGRKLPRGRRFGVHATSQHVRKEPTWLFPMDFCGAVPLPPISAKADTTRTARASAFPTS